MRIVSDDTVIKFNFSQAGYTDITNTAPSYTINAGAILTFNRMGVRGEAGTTSPGGTTYTGGQGIAISGSAISVADDGVTGAQIADDAVGSEHIVDNSIDLAHLASGTAGMYLGYDTSGNPAELTAPTGGTTYTGSDGISVSGSSITLTDDGVTLAKLASGTAGRYLGYDTSGNPAELVAPTNGGTGTTYTGGQGIAISGSTIELADDGVISEKIADDAILTAHITDVNITRAKIALDAIDGTLIADDAIANVHLGNAVVQSSNIGAAQIITSLLAANSVTTGKVGTGAVTEPKIGADAVTQAKIADDAVQIEHLNANTEISEGNITDGTSNVIGTITGRRVDLAINVLAPETQHYHIFVTRTLDAGGEGTTLSSSSHMIFYVFSGTEWDIEMFQHTDLPTNYLDHLQPGTDIRLVSGDTEWLGQITETLEASTSGAIFRINFSEQQTGSFATDDSIRISFGYAPAAITLVSDGETLLGGGTLRNKFRINIDAPTSANDAQVMAWSDGDSKYVWADNSGGTGGTTYTAGTGIDITSNAISIADDGVDTAQIAAEAVETEQVNDDSITLSKLAHGTADKYLGYNSSGVPAELDAPEGGDASSAEIAQRAEQLVFAAITTVVTQTNDERATLAATSFASVVYPSGETTLEILEATAGETTATILSAGIYAIDISADIIATGDRAYPSLEVYASAAVIGTDAPLAIIPTVYIREDETDVRRIVGSAHLRIVSDDTVVKFNFIQTGYSDLDIPSYTVNSGAILTFNRLGTRGDIGPESEFVPDLYEDYPTALTTNLHTSDRIPIADVGLDGEPNRHVRIGVLQEYFADLDNRITTEETTLADTDKFFFHDDSASAMRYIEKSDLESEFGGSVDLYEDFPTEIDSTLVAQDRMVISDVDDTDQPNRHVRLDDLGGYFADLRDRIPTGRAAVDANDRIFLSVESLSGDPMRYATAETLSNYILDLNTHFATEETTIADTDKFFFYDISASAMRYIEKSDLESELSVSGGGATSVGIWWGQTNDATPIQQTDRFPVGVELTANFNNGGLLAWSGGTADETFGDGLTATFANHDEVSDSDRTSVDIPNGLIQPGAGTYHIRAVMATDISNDENAAISIIKVQSGTDDALITQRPGDSLGGSGTGLHSSIETVFDVKAEYITLSATDYVYVRITSISGQTFLGVGYIQFEEI